MAGLFFLAFLVSDYDLLAAIVVEMDGSTFTFVEVGGPELASGL